MKWYRKLYVSESIGDKAGHIKWKINHNAGTASVYVIAFASNPDNLLDIIPAWQLMQKSYPKKNLKIIGLAIVMLTLDLKLALISFVLLPVVAVLTVVFRKISRKTYRITRTRLTDLNTFLSENISGMRIIQIFGREERKFDEFNDRNYKYYRAFYREMLVFAIFRPLIYILSVLSLMLVLGVGSREVLGNVISIGTLYIFAQYIQSFFEPIQELAEQFSTLQSSLASAEKIFTIMDEDALVPEPGNALTYSAASRTSSEVMSSS